MTAPNVTNVAGRAAERGVTLWGAPGAGKSGLLGALYASSLHPDVDGWSAHPKDCEDASTQERLKDAYLGLRGRTNTKTGMPAAGEYPALRVVLRRTRARRPIAALPISLVDPAGEFSTQLELGTTRDGRALFARIARGGGVLWLVEAERRADDVEARMLMLQHLVALLEQSGGRQLAIPVALCLSKVDCLDDAARAAARTDPGAALRTHLGETAFTWFEAVCPTMRCFAVTSTGTVDGRVQPEGLDDVFDWLAHVTEPRMTLRERVTRAIGAIGALTPVVRERLAPLARVTRIRVRGRAARVLVALAVVGTLGAAAARAKPSLSSLPSMRSPGWLTSLRAVPSRVRTALRGRSTASAGEVTRPARNTLAEPQAASRFDAARDAAARGAWTETLAALADGVPPAPLRFAWDSLYVSAALSQAAVEPDPVVVRQLRQAARDRATDAVRIGPAGSRRVTGLRFARGVACMDGRLDCPRADVVADFTWALLGPEPMRRDASRRLAALRRQPEARP